jgi:endogenous inhibitor of DNA gyrase (YacG/DUF329 family)
VTRESSPATATTKATLFCPECSYQARYDGAWVVEESDGRIRYRCPACDTPVTTRPSGGELPPDRSSTEGASRERDSDNRLGAGS